MIKHAKPDHAIQPLLSQRWSPYVFADKAVADADLFALFEAARWAASSYNAQPWRFIVARQQDARFADVLGCLFDVNQVWAQHASVLALGITNTLFDHNDRANAAAEHDLGLAAASLSLEATARGIAVHQMIGVHGDRAREAFALPPRFKPLTALAIGYAGNNPALAPELASRDLRARERRPLGAFVFGDGWETPATFLGGSSGG